MISDKIYASAHKLFEDKRVPKSWERFLLKAYREGLNTKNSQGRPVAADARKDPNDSVDKQTSSVSFMDMTAPNKAIEVEIDFSRQTDLFSQELSDL